MALLAKSDVVALLGRPLTTVEDTNFNLYLEIAEENVADLLCIPLEVQTAETVAEERTFIKRREFSTVFTPIFTEVTKVLLDDEETTNYTRAFWDNRNADEFNSIILTVCSLNRDYEVKITAKWGFTTLPATLKRLIAQAFAVVSSKYQVKDVKSKKIEDFTITFGDILSEDDVHAQRNARTIKKYSICGIVDIQSGDICYWRR